MKDAVTPDLSHLRPFLTEDAQIDMHALAVSNGGYCLKGKDMTVNSRDIDRLQQAAWAMDSILLTLAAEDEQALKFSDAIRGGLLGAARVIQGEVISPILQRLSNQSHKH